MPRTGYFCAVGPTGAGPNMMRKAVTKGTLTGKERSGRSYWMRAGPVGPKAASNNEAQGKRASKARFLEPYRLSETQRSALIRILAVGGIGDAEGRELFASAIEYDIANARQALAREGTEPPSERTASDPATGSPSEARPKAISTDLPIPAELSEVARSFAERIAGLEEPTRNAIAEAMHEQDAFQRRYDSAYFEALRAELTRLADAVTVVVRTPHPMPAQPPSQTTKTRPLGKAARRFLRRMARVYEEVLESPAAPTPEGTFYAILRLVSEEVGIVLPQDPAEVARTLQAS
jgi:hypothetical protein